jgi:hypothetical protein
MQPVGRIGECKRSNEYEGRRWKQRYQDAESAQDERNDADDHPDGTR